MRRKIQLNLNQLALPFSEGNSKALSLEGRERFFWGLVSVSLCSLLIYVYAINAAAHHIAVRQNLEKQVERLNGDLSVLEFETIALKNGVTMEVATNYGFSEVREPLYVSRDAENSLTLNTVKR